MDKSQSLNSFGVLPFTERLAYYPVITIMIKNKNYNLMRNGWVFPEKEVIRPLTWSQEYSMHNGVLIQPFLQIYCLSVPSRTKQSHKQQPMFQEIDNFSKRQHKNGMYQWNIVHLALLKSDGQRNEDLKESSC